jgi:hypothetical protein
MAKAYESVTKAYDFMRKAYDSIVKAINKMIKTGHKERELIKDQLIAHGFSRGIEDPNLYVGL